MRWTERDLEDLDRRVRDLERTVEDLQEILEEQPQVQDEDDSEKQLRNALLPVLLELAKNLNHKTEPK